MRGIFELTPEENEFIKNFRIELGGIAVASVIEYIALARENLWFMLGGLGAFGTGVALGGARSKWAARGKPRVETEPEAESSLIERPILEE